MKPIKSPVLGVTGGIACGKSAAGDLLKAEGWAVCDADAITRALLEPGHAVYDAVVRRFGPGLVLEDGGIDRKALADRVFGDVSERQALNALMHPPARAAWRAWMGERRAEGRPAAVLIPLLFEVGETEGWTAIVCITADEAVAMKRLEARGLTEDEARARIRAQWPLEEKAKRSDFVVENNGTVDDLADRMRQIVQRLTSGEEKQDE